MFEELPIARVCRFYKFNPTLATDNCELNFKSIDESIMDETYRGKWETWICVNFKENQDYYLAVRGLAERYWGKIAYYSGGASNYLN